MDPDLLVIGHSFVKQLQVSLLRRGCTTQIVGADLGVSARKVVLCQAMPRVAVRPTGPRRYATRADFNDARFVVNRTLDALTSDHYWRHRGMHANWEQYFDSCGVHLNEVGMRKYVRSIRGAALFAVGPVSLPSLSTG